SSSERCVGAGLVMPDAAMPAPLAEIGAAVAPGGHDPDAMSARRQAPRGKRVRSYGGWLAVTSAASSAERWRLDGSVLGGIVFEAMAARRLGPRRHRLRSDVGSTARSSAPSSSERCVGAGLAMPDAAMPAPLAEIGAAVAPGVDAGLVLDPAVRHMSATLAVPDTVPPDTVPLDTVPLEPLPPRSPELNPVETIWQVMRDTRLSNRVFTS
ncbi:MAG: hypothetical protein AAGI50_09930, partial [Pseudomonadota bacterium]